MNRVVGYALTHRGLVLGLMSALIGVGVFAFWRLNIEAYPDPVPPLVDIVTQSAGQSAEEIERYVTIPIEVQLAGIPHTTTVRTISLFGLSDVKVQFTYDLTYDEAVQQVINRLAQLPALPNGVQPQISPVSPVGEIYRYRVEGPPGFSLTDLKTLQDWVLQRRFKAIPGVVDVTGWGGTTKTYDVNVDQARLRASGVTLMQVLQSLQTNNSNAGGQTLDIGSQSVVVHGVGLIRSVGEIESTMVAQVHGEPVRVRDVANVTAGVQPRLGIAGLDGTDDIVQGIVLMRRGAQSDPTIAAVKAEIARINAGGILPPGVHLSTIYDRSQLIAVTTRTVLHNLLFGCVLIFALQWVFLGDLRSALVVAATIPFALSFAVSLMVLRGESANLLSMGAIDFGLVVDASVIMVESIYRHLGESLVDRRAGEPLLHRMRTSMGFSGKFDVISLSAASVSKAILFSAAIIVAGFLPLFTLSGIEGHIFSPMARTYAYAIAGGIIATFTISPALSSYVFKGDLREHETIVVGAIKRVYLAALDRLLAGRVWVLAIAALVFLGTGVAASHMGLEFLPKLEEGNLWIRATMPMSISLRSGNRYVNEMRKVIGSFDEVERTVSQHGRPDDGTDATGFFNAEFFVPLKPQDQWVKHADKQSLTDDMTRRLNERFPGVEFNFSQYIEDNVEEAASGVKGENSVKIFGPDLRTLQRLAGEIATLIQSVPGVTDLAVLQSLGQPTLDVSVDREKAARYGVAPADVNSAVQVAVGGQSAGDLYESGSDRHFPVVVRLGAGDRSDPEALRRLQLTTPDPSGNGTIALPLGDVASLRLISGPSFIYREQQERYIPVKFGVRGRDLGSAILDAQRRVESTLKLPPGYRVEWVGEFGNLAQAARRLAIAVPSALVLIGLLLYLNFGSLRDVLLAASVIPMSLIGGILALTATGTPFSISAAIGFIALFGIATMDGILVLAYFNQHVDTGLGRREALRRTAEVQFRPVLMTCMVACIGLVPAALSTGIGSQVQKPLALVVVGGIAMTPIFVLTVLPVLIDLFSKRGAAPVSPAVPTSAEGV